MSVSTTRHLFDLTGGDLALDLANTKDRRPTPAPEEHLQTYDDLVSWGVQAGAIPREDAVTLRRLGARSRRATRAALRRALDLRESLFAIFAAVAGGGPPPEDALARVNALLPEALARLRLVRAGTGADWTWADSPDLDRVVWPVLRSAALLLTAPDRECVRECAARDCAWLFLDRSRNATRRWCDMAVCGNREKARRFQKRASRPQA